MHRIQIRQRDKKKAANLYYQHFSHQSGRQKNNFLAAKPLMSPPTDDGLYQGRVSPPNGARRIWSGRGDRGRHWTSGARNYGTWRHYGALKQATQPRFSSFRCQLNLSGGALAGKKDLFLLKKKGQLVTCRWKQRYHVSGSNSWHVYLAYNHLSISITHGYLPIFTIVYSVYWTGRYIF